MADGFSMRVITADTQRVFRQIDRSVNRATMYAVRAAGRKVRQEAAKRAPVYRGTRADIPKGRLKKSIHSDKRLRRIGTDGFSVRVGPRGYPAQTYAPKREGESRYMQGAHAAVAPQLEQIAASAWERAMKGRR